MFYVAKLIRLGNQTQLLSRAAGTGAWLGRASLLCPQVQELWLEQPVSHWQEGSGPPVWPENSQDALFPELLSLVNSCFLHCVLWPFLPFLSPQITEQNCVFDCEHAVYMYKYVCVRACVCEWVHVCECISV